MGVPTPSQPRHSSTKWGRVLGMSHYSQRRTVLFSSTSGNQSAVRTGGSQVSQSAVEWRSAVGSRQSVSSQRRGQRRRPRRRTTVELPAHCRTCSAGTIRILSRRRSRLHFAGHAALPPATEATTATDAEAEAEATDTESGLQRSSLHGCLVLIDTRPLAVGAAPVSPSSLPLFHIQQSRRRRRWRTTTAAMPTAAAHLGPGAAATAASAVADTATILPHGAWWTPPGARCTRTDACSCMLHWWQDDEHSDGEGAATAATTRRSSATAGALLASLPLLPNGTVQSWHGHAKARSCEGRLRLHRQQERRHLGLRCSSGVRQGSVGPTSSNSHG